MTFLHSVDQAPADVVDLKFVGTETVVLEGVRKDKYCVAVLGRMRMDSLDGGRSSLLKL
jgi:hypothetical protein